MHRGAWRATVHVVAKSRTRLSKTLLLLVAVYHSPEDYQGALFLPLLMSISEAFSISFILE